MLLLNSVHLLGHGFVERIRISKVIEILQAQKKHDIIMKKLLFILIVSSFCSTLSAQTYKTYRIAYVLTPYGNYDPENAFITITEGQIRYKKNGREKHWQSMFRGMYKEQPTKGVTFQYECFQLMKLDKMIRISKTKNVKHNGKFYYAMYVDGQLQLAE